MNRKGRTRRSKIPMAVTPPIRNGAGATAPPDADTSASGTASAPQMEMVKLTSSPRPKAPALHFSSPATAAQEAPRSAEQDGAARDDVSVPPIDIDHGFFDSAAGSAESSVEIDTRDPRVAMKLTPRVARRRAQLAKYVTMAVGLSALLCVAALVKVGIARSHEETRSSLPSSVAQAAAAAAPALNTATTTEPAPSPPSAANSAPTDTPPAPESAAQPTGQPAAAGSAAAAASASTGAAAATAANAANAPSPATVATAITVATAAGAPTGWGAPTVPGAAQSVVAPVQSAAATAVRQAAPPPEATPPDPKTAAKEKAKSQGALERGNLAGAIAAGEQSVAIDPTDAEAWLILGAAYQQRGDAKNALRSFRACVEQGRRGPKNECAAMLR